MARHYVIQDWSSSAEYSGELIGNRLSKSEGHHFTKNGMANTDLYADEPKQKKPSIHIRDRILPQQRRVTTLTNQMRELVSEYQKGNIDIDEYSMLLSVISSKRAKAEILLAKAKSVRAAFEIEEEEAISLGKTHVKNEKSFKRSKGSACSASVFKAAKRPTNSFSLSKVADWINNHQFTYFVVCSTIALTAAKIVF